MSRIIRAEFKKLFLRPSIFVVTGVLILVLAMCSFLYTPRNRDSLAAPTIGNTVGEIFTNFKTSHSDYSFGGYNEYLSNTSSFIDFYSTERDLIEELLSLCETLKTKFNTYQSVATSYIEHGGNYENVVNARDAVKNHIISIRTFYNTEVVNKVIGSSDKISVLSTTQLNISVLSLIARTENIFFDETSGEIGKEKDIVLFSEWNNIDIYNKLKVQFQMLIVFQPNVEYVSSLTTYVTEAMERLGIMPNPNISSSEKYIATGEGLLKTITQFATTNSASETPANLAKIRQYITDYRATCIEVFNICTNGTYLNGLSDFSNSQLNSYRGFENNNFYEMKERQVKFEFLFNTNSHADDYANPFSISQPSNTDINAYDFSYFSMRLCSFIIIIYIVATAATTVVGELNSGTMKLLAIRPFSRRKLLGGKILATLLIGALLIVISAVATFVIGAINFSVASLPVLAIFNATNAFVISPIFLYLIALFTLIIEMAFFAMIALTISMLFKSTVGSVAISILIYFGTLVLNTLSTKTAFLRFLPFTNIGLYKYFGSAFLSTHGGFIEAILTPSVVIGSNFWLSFIYVTLFIVVLTVITFQIFKRRDIK